MPEEEDAGLVAADNLDTAVGADYTLAAESGCNLPAEGYAAWRTWPCG